MATRSGLATRSRPAIPPMTLSRARALRATSRKRIGVAALSGAQRVTHLGRRKDSFLMSKIVRKPLPSLDFRDLTDAFWWNYPLNLSL